MSTIRLPINVAKLLSSSSLKAGFFSKNENELFKEKEKEIKKVYEKVSDNVGWTLFADIVLNIIRIFMMK